jgi:hypothetical protein
MTMTSLAPPHVERPPAGEHTHVDRDADRTPIEVGAPSAGDGKRRVRRMLRRRWKRILAVIVVLAAPVGWSYVGYLRAPGSASWSERSVEWTRDHGGEGIVNHVEQWWYTRTAPGDGIPVASRLPTVPVAVPARDATVDASTANPAPADVVPIAPDPMSGEGIWMPGVQSVDGVPLIYSTFLRPDVENTAVVAAVLEFDQHLVRTVAVPGTKEPGGSGWRWASGIPAAERGPLVAAFNSGFRFRHIEGGYFTEGRTAVPLVNGDASLVIDRDGRVDVGAWGTDLTMSPDIVTVRQNLHLIVDRGVVVRGLKDNADGLWGKRKHQLQFTWRSGVGVTADGNLVLVAGDKMTLTAIATALADAGAVRGMQLDIHTQQVTVNLFQPVATSSTAVMATKLLPNMPRPASRFLGADQRDFFAVFVR